MFIRLLGNRHLGSSQVLPLLDKPAVSIFVYARTCVSSQVRFLRPIGGIHVLVLLMDVPSRQALVQNSHNNNKTWFKKNKQLTQARFFPFLFFLLFAENFMVGCIHHMSTQPLCTCYLFLPQTEGSIFQALIGTPAPEWRRARAALPLRTHGWEGCAKR